MELPKTKVQKIKFRNDAKNVSEPLLLTKAVVAYLLKSHAERAAN